jgi:hypothetical protein
MAEITSKRTYSSKTYDLGGGRRRGEFHAGHIHYKDAENNFREVDLVLVDKGTYWEMTKASHRLRIAKDFDALELIRFTNRYKGANHTIKYSAHSLWWFDATNPQAERTKIVDAQSVTGVLVDPYTVRYINAFGVGIHFEVTVRRNGVQKNLNVDDRSDLGTPPYSDYFLVPVFTWSAAGLNVKASDLPAWDNESYYESEEALTISELNPAYSSKISKAKGWDSSTPCRKSKNLKVIFEKKGGVLYQGKLITKTMIENAVFPIWADTTTNYYAVTGDGFISAGDAVWATARAASTGTVETGDLTIFDALVYEDTGYAIERAFIPINTSEVDDDAVITAAVFNFYVTLIANDDNDGDDYLALVQTSAADPDSLVGDDFDQCGNPTAPTEGSNQLDLGSVSVDAFNQLTLNATGRGWVSKTGYTLLGMREGHDLTGNAVADASFSGAQISSEATANDPYLAVTYYLLHDLVPTGSLHSHSADAATLTAAAQLVAAGSLHSHSADATALTRVAQLVAAGSLHSHSADAAALTRVAQLVAAGSLHAHDAESITTTIVAQLVAAGSLHAHAAESIATTIVAQLTAAGSLHAHAAEQAVLTIITAIVIADSLHSHTAENVIVDTVIILLVAGGLHAHDAESTALTIVAQLTAAGGLHAHTADDISIIRVATLVIDDVLHDLSSDQVILTIVGGETYLLVVEGGLHAHTAASVILADAWKRIIIQGRDARTGRAVKIIGSYREI